MKDLLSIFVVVGALGICSSMRAFPIDSQGMVEGLFQEVNPRIRWDETNFLADMAGKYAQCKYLYQDGAFELNIKDQERGGDVGGYRSTYAGELGDWQSVEQYLRSAMPRWTTDPVYRPQIQRAETFGCSVRPRCPDRGGYQMSIACLFSPAYGGEKPVPNPTANPNARAFTPQQYDLAEGILGISWDRTKYLENLSGKEADCSMIARNSYTFPEASKENELNKKEGDYVHIDGLFGSSPNLGDTENAMVRVLNTWAKDEVQKLRTYPGIQIGCSLIADCFYGQQMYVVVSCLYSSY